MTVTEPAPSGAPLRVPPDFSGNPHAFLARLREAGPAHRVFLPDGTESWWITQYEAVDAADRKSVV